MSYFTQLTGAAGILVISVTLSAGASLAQDAAGVGAVPTVPVEAAPAPVTSPAPVASPVAGSAETPAASPSESAPGVPADVSPTAAAGTLPGETEAQAVAARPAGCLLPPAGATPEEVDAFLANPSETLQNYGTTTIEISGRVRALVGGDRRALDGVIGLLPAANSVQLAGIGAGLGRAAFACIATDPIYASEIQSRVAELQSPALLTAFLAASNDVQVAALGATGASGGGASAAAGLSGTGDAGPGSGGLNGDDVTPQTAATSTGSSRTVPIDTNDGDNTRTVERIIERVVTVPVDECDESVSPSCQN